ncbi:gluconokinase KNAG_0A04070 [Huiozyma naganishii CBS 8797]|uniref:Gluconokinase n=1 Tax=Huiozyma naganishii (strain ATCC MYA-139 / BCRC 22969 / CBS 8797 / KCTC 17520 / NBRC 10181 / NCYC 3082 / Yp74L-3) TaxID=1071383 RepID=J7S3N8_HUIN7|nr:hypothetical protein KNAG_0A04070 [Kazachstania naganishii CBS 8797]CCK68086.1 hypothetical protein KNAG_0A04070 [Kazachstania naganishii CBS 8797]
MSDRPKVIVLAGTAGTGKSTIAHTLIGVYSGKCSNMKFIEGDDLHPKENVAKMASGTPLNDEDRWGWLQTVAKAGSEEAKQCPSKVSIVACSSLKLKYRDLIRETVPDTDFSFVFLYASKENILKRLYQRSGHFMKSDMADSQFRDLELPLPDEKDCYIVNMDDKTYPEIEEIVHKVCDEIMAK